jgi:DNA-binding response OmpR family regulator
MSIVLLSGDLLVVSRVAGAAAEFGAKLDSATTVEQAASACSELSADILIVDLATPALDIAALAAAVRSAADGKPKIVAFGPHVHEARLAAAREAGCDEVVSRGQFFGQLESILHG